MNIFSSRVGFKAYNVSRLTLFLKASQCNCYPAKQKSNFEIQQIELFKLAPLYL